MPLLSSHPKDTQTKRRTRSGRLLSVVEGYEAVAIITHDNPDPDAIASGWAICRLIEKRAGLTPRLIGGGGIVRAENREMLRLLNPPIELLNGFDPTDRTAVILVDCGLAGGNHLLAGQSVRPVAVIDHHDVQRPAGRDKPRLPFEDSRPRVAATATIAASYLREQRINPDECLATALLYAIRTETRGAECHYSRLDRGVVSWLTTYANPAFIAEIENAPLPRAYFGDLVLALQKTFVYDTCALCFLPRAEGPETVGEVSDLLVRCEGIHRVLCAGVFEHEILLSVRTDKGHGSAAHLVRDVLSGIGQGGGHQHRAGGKITQLGQGDWTVAQMCDELRNRWLAACCVDRQRGSRLVAKREIVENL